MEKIDETGEVLDLASDGRGIVRQEGLVTFIPFTAQGDVIQYHTTQRKKNFAFGSLLKILEPSQDRILPLCSYYGTCGGCQLQHISYQKQLEHKRRWVEDALKRIGKFSDVSVPPVVPTDLQWGYRRRIHLVLRKKQQGFQAGYIAVDNTSLVAVESCPIFTERQDPILKAVQDICKELQSPDDTDGKVTLLKSHAGYIAHFHFKVMPVNAAHVLADSLQRYSFIQGVLATSSRQSLQFGTVQTSCMIDGLSFDLTPKTFIQNHPEQSANIYRKIVEIAEALNLETAVQEGKVMQDFELESLIIGGDHSQKVKAPPVVSDSGSKNCVNLPSSTVVSRLKPARILDLYCGIGISSLLLARRGSRVTGVELNPEAIKIAAKNARENSVEGVHFIAADVEKVLPLLLKKEEPDFIIINPPREGLSPAVIQQLKTSAAPNLVYISCMPSTLARDLHLLCQQDYRLVSVEAFDMFPQTVHVETCVVLRNVHAVVST